MKDTIGTNTGTYSATHSETIRPTMTIMQAGQAVGVSRRTIYNWLGTGKVEYIRTAGGSVRIFVDTLFRGPDRTEPHPGSLNSRFAPKVP